MSGVDIEVEDEAWRGLADVEAVVEQAVLATLQFRPLWGRGTAREYARGGGGGGAGGEQTVMNTGAETAQSEPAAAGAAPTTNAFSDGPPPPEGAVPSSSVTILLTSDDEVAELNERFRHKPGPTNVLSFPAPPNPENHLGDIALAYGVCAREAAEQGKSLADHLRHLTVHGVLHLAGYDHQTDDEAQAMEALERRVLAGLGVADPYADEQS